MRPIAFPLLLVLAAAAAPAPRAEPETCPWCADDADARARLGTLRHGPFEFARGTTDAVRDALPASQWVFVETEHLRLASSLGPLRLTSKDRKRMAADLDRLREALPQLPKNPRELDPWLRLHLMALRCEDFYARFQDLLGVTDDDFPEARAADGPYMGDGRYLGEKSKFELIWHTSRRTHFLFTEELMGGRVTDALRWHLSPEHKLIASIPAEDGDLKQHRWLIPHSAHLMSHLFLCAYKHFSYDPPIWLDEGLAHALERELEPDSTTIDGDEGSGPHRGGREDWTGEDARLAKDADCPSFAEMLRWNAFHDLDDTAHRAVWSRVRFLLEAHPEGFARFVGGVKGQLDERGYPTGRDLVGLQRELLKEIWGWSPAEFDDAWRAWARERE